MAFLKKTTVKGHPRTFFSGGLKKSVNVSPHGRTIRRKPIRGKPLSERSKYVRLDQSGRLAGSGIIVKGGRPLGIEPTGRHPYGSQADNPPQKLTSALRKRFGL